jgi:hypothetical protein
VINVARGLLVKQQSITVDENTSIGKKNDGISIKVV